MAEATVPTTQDLATSVDTRVAAAKLRALANPGFEPRVFLKTISPTEIGAIVIFLLLVASVVIIYTFWILPDQVRRAQLNGEIAANRGRIEELQKSLQDPGAIKSEFERVRTSLDQFRTDYLKPRRAGRLDIIQSISTLTQETGVSLASPVDFSTSDPAAEAVVDTKAKSKHKSRKQEGEITAYPSMNMTFSINGNYQQLRNFIAKFERSSQFVVIDAVTLKTEDKEDRAGKGEGGSRGGHRTVASLPPGTVTLEISMTAYFQPDSTAGIVQVASAPQ